MNFTSFAFLGFFVGVFALYWALPTNRPRMAWLLLASAGYYMTFNPWLILLILTSAAVDYFAAQAIERTQSNFGRRAWLIGSIAINLGILCYFKYSNFFLSSLGLEQPLRVEDLLLPLGISFYTFETISYIVDVYTGKTKAVRDPLDYALFILFFPHLLAGPIVRAGHFLPQIERPKRLTGDRAWLGVQLIVRGLFKKLVLADNLAFYVVDPVFKDAVGYGSTAVWLAAIAYAIQVYGDFAGYSDIAIGLAHLLDFRLPQNFKNPYLATSPADFWRRWHISLSGWLRDYLFIPLGGSRGGAWMACRNLILVMTIGGLWHGPTWMCVLWGLYHGLLLAGQRLVRWPAWMSHAAARPLCVVGTFVLMCIGLVIFRSQSPGDIGILLTKLAVPTVGIGLSLSLAALVGLSLSLVWVAGTLDESGLVRDWDRRLPAPVLGSMIAVQLSLVMLFMPPRATLFMYFQF